MALYNIYYDVGNGAQFRDQRNATNVIEAVNDSVKSFDGIQDFTLDMVFAVSKSTKKERKQKRRW